MKDVLFKIDKTGILAEAFLQAMIIGGHDASPAKAFELAIEYIREGQRRGCIEIAEPSLLEAAPK